MAKRRGRRRRRNPSAQWGTVARKGSGASLLALAGIGLWSTLTKRASVDRFGSEFAIQPIEQQQALTTEHLETVMRQNKTALVIAAPLVLSAVGMPGPWATYLALSGGVTATMAGVRLAQDPRLTETGLPRIPSRAEIGIGVTGAALQAGLGLYLLLSRARD